jgi:hypothetical protein
LDLDDLEYENVENFDTETTSYYKENIFSIEDIYLFRGVLYFYLYQVNKNESSIVKAMKDLK